MASQSEIEEQQLKKKQKIAQQLKEQKQLEVINMNAGKGSYGEVMIVQDHQRQYAIKIISVFDGVNDVCDKELEIAKKEANILKNCSHPNIVKYFDDFLIGYNYFILMEKCEMSLQDWIEQGYNKNIIDLVFIDFALQILEAVQYLHQKNLLLRDISLKNILLDHNSNIKLCDFGLAKEINLSLSQQAFQTKSIKGAFFYWPPENLQVMEKGDNSFEQKSEIVYQNIEGDIWAIGICLYSLAGASSIHIFQYASEKETFQIQHSIGLEINQVLIDVLQRNPKLRPKVSNLIEIFKRIKTKIQAQQTSTSSSVPENQQIDENKLFLSAQSLFYSYEYKQSILILKQLIDKHPSSDRYLAWIGRVYRINNQQEKCDKYSNKAISINSNNDIAYFNLGSLCLQKNKLDEAVKYFKKSIEINPQLEAALLNLGYVYENQGQTQEANRYYQLAINQAHFNLGSVQECQGSNSEVISYYKQVIDQAHYNLGSLYQDGQMFDEAISNYKQVQSNPLKTNTLFAFGNIYSSQSKYNDAINYYEKYIQINPNDEEALFNIALIYQKQGKYDQACIYYKQALMINPKQESAQINLAIINAKIKKKELESTLFKKDDLKRLSILLYIQEELQNKTNFEYPQRMSENKKN